MAQIRLTTSEASPTGGRSGPLIRDGLLLVSAALMALTLWMVFFWVPTEANLGVSQRIFYFHVPVAILALVSIVVVAAASARYVVMYSETYWLFRRQLGAKFLSSFEKLTTHGILHRLALRLSKGLISERPSRDAGEKWDALAYSAAELGAVLATLAIVTGAIWAKPVWGVWWTWDPKLTLMLVLWFIYAGYLMLRAYGPKGSQGARYGAVIALMGTVNVPIIYYATELWQAAHPALLVGPAAESGSLDSDMALGLMVSTITFIVLAAYVLIERYSLRRSETAIDALYQQVT